MKRSASARRRRHFQKKRHVDFVTSLGVAIMRVVKWGHQLHDNVPEKNINSVCVREVRNCIKFCASVGEIVKTEVKSTGKFS